MNKLEAKGGIVTKEELLNLMKERRVFVCICTNPDYYIRVTRKNLLHFLDNDPNKRDSPVIIEVLKTVDYSYLHVKIKNNT